MLWFRRFVNNPRARDVSFSSTNQNLSYDTPPGFDNNNKSSEMLQGSVLGPAISPGQLLHASNEAGPSREPLPLHGLSFFNDHHQQHHQPRKPLGRVHQAVESQRSCGGDGDDIDEYSEEELVWYDRTVVWSRGSEVFRRYTYEQEEESVAQAVFAWFKTGKIQDDCGQHNSESSHPTTSSSDTLGPFHHSQKSRWGGPQSSSKDDATPCRLERTLVVFLQTKARLYFASGEDITIHLPFAIDGAWPLSRGGILVQRALERRELKKLGKEKKKVGSVLRGLADHTSMTILDDLMDLDDDHAPSLPRLYALETPFDELKMIVEGKVEDGFNDWPGHLISKTRSIGSSNSVLYLSPDPYPFIIAHNQQTGDIVFYRKTPVPDASDQRTPPPPNPLTLRPEESLRPPDLHAPPPRSGRQSLRPNPSAFGAATDRRMSSAADPLDRTQRSGPRMSRSIAQETPVPTDELQAALDPTPIVPPTTTKRRSRATSIMSTTVPNTDGHRRTSASFLFQEKQGPFGLHAVAEQDLRETTMMMGLERAETGARSEVVLDKVYSWRPPFTVDPEDISVFLSDNLSSTHVMINIHISRPSHAPQLFTFLAQLRSSPYTHFMITPSPPIDCISAIAVISTRPKILDTLVLARNGAFQIITSGGRSIPFHIPHGLSEGHDEVARKFASSLRVGIDYRHTKSNSDRKAIALLDPVGPRFTVVYEDGEKIRVSADLVIRHQLTRQCLFALSHVLPAQEFFYLKREVVSAVRQLPSTLRRDRQATWDVFSNVLRKMLQLKAPDSPKSPFGTVLSDSLRSSDHLVRRLARRIHRPGLEASTPPGSSAPLQYGEIVNPAGAAHIMLALHFVAQDLRLSSTRRKELGVVARVISDIASKVGRMDWKDYWARLVPTEVSHGSCAQDVCYDTSILERYDSPPDILTHLSRQTVVPTKPFPSPQSLLVPTHLPEMGARSPCKQTDMVTSVYSLLGPSLATPSASVRSRAAATVQYMVSRGLDAEWLADLPYGVALPILEAIRICQHHPPKDWTAELHAFTGRMDLALQSKGEDISRDEPVSQLGPERIPTIKELMGSDKGEESKHSSHRLALPHVRFGSDRRVREVERIMQTTRVRTIIVQDSKGASEQDIGRYHQTVVNTIANRTLSIPVGQGMFEFGTRSTNVTDLWDIPLIELSVKISSVNTTLKAEIVSDSAEWPCFHNGVSAGLAISPDCKGIDSSWIVFNRPSILNAEHGGFLLGLGLTGHLRSLMTYDAFPLMEPRHDFTSVGLLLGLACSYAGSEDLLITKVLSLHTHALLPLGSMELNASPIIQSSAMVGLGLVYAGSRNLRMAEVALSEVGRTEMPNVDGFVESQEAYSFSASMAFGLIMLGRGGKMTSEVDRRMLAKLRRCILGDSPPLDGAQSKTTLPSIDSNLTGPGATLALGFMYLKTGRQDIADMLEIPQTAFDLDQVRPELLLLRTLTRALITWDTITPTMGWIEDQLPPFIRHANTFKGTKRSSTMDLATELAYLNIIAGACFAIGLKYAGTATELAHSNLMSFFGVLSKAATGSSMTYEGRIRRTAARQGLNVVTLALSMVMSGTGELSVLRRLRVSHGQEGAGVTYGTHMAMHMALGMLFLGRGHYTLGTSNLALATMCISFFPRFLPSPSDNKAYPQAFRHLWALAVEPRCLVARDVDTLETVYLPVKLRVREDKRSGSAATSTIRQQSLISPTLVAPFENIVSVEVDSPRYWPIVYDLSNPRDKANLVKTRTIYVKRKAGFLDYNSDPKGNRGIFSRAGSMTGIDLHYDLISPAAPPGVSAEEVEGLVRAHSGNAGLVALAKLFKDDSAGFDVFIRTAMLECLSLDKPSILSTYLSMYEALRAHKSTHSPQSTVEEMNQLAVTKSFYSEVFEKSFAPALAQSAGSGAGGEKRFSLIRPSFVSSLSRTLSSSLALTRADEDTIRDYLLTNRPSESSDAWVQGDNQALARWIQSNNLPPISLLCMLHDKVRQSAMERDIVELKVWEVAENHRKRLIAAYDLNNDHPTGASEPVENAGGEGWRWDSVRDVIRVWKS